MTEETSTTPASNIFEVGGDLVNSGEAVSGNDSTVPVMTTTINGHTILSSDQQISCRFGPNEVTGEYVYSTISR